MKRTEMRGAAGFTIPELVVVIVVVVVAIFVSLVLIHPHDYTIQNRNNQRRLGLAAISQGIGRYYRNTGKLPDGITATAATIGSESDNVDLCTALVPKYMRDIPIDPSAGVEYGDTCKETGDNPGAYNAQYLISRDKTGAVVLSAPAAERGQKIELRHTY